MEDKDVLLDKLRCAACLCVGRTLYDISDEKLQKFYLDIIKEVPLPNIPQHVPNMCWECVISLNKAVTFREQVKDSIRIIQSYTSENINELLLSAVRPYRLGVHHIAPLNISPSICLDTFYEEPTKDALSVDADTQGVLHIENNADRVNIYDDDCKTDGVTDNVGNVQRVYVKEEIKMEWNNLDERDFEDDTPLNEFTDVTFDMESVLKPTRGIDKAIPPLISKVKRKKHGKTTDKIKKTKKLLKRLKADFKTKMPKEEAGQTIKTIELNYEDMLLERDRDSKKDSYINAKYKCDSCIVGFNYVKSYKAHVSNRHSEDIGDYCCPICKTIIASVDSFTAHYKRHLRRYECSICPKRTMDLKAMQQHYYSTHEITLKEYKCKLCGKVSNSSDTHRYHMDSHKSRVPCPDCDKTFSHRAGLMNHRLAVHEYKNEFPCPICNKNFKWKTSLKRHVLGHESRTQSAASCETCGVNFTSQSSYARHMRTSLRHVSHTQLRFICDHCNRRFADKTKLRDHIEEKHLHKTYHCPMCGKSSKNRVNMDQHIRNVHKGRPNNKMCHHCGKGFPTRVQLESHIRTHTGERPFICEFCPTTFSQQTNLNKHYRQVHLNIKSKRYPVSKKAKNVEVDTIPTQEFVPRSLQYTHEINDLYCRVNVNK